MRRFFLGPAVLLAVIAGQAGAVEPVVEARIEGRAVLDGEADDRLRAIGRRAAREHLALQVSAPDLWERRILDPIRVGAGDASLTIKYVNALSDVVTITGIPVDQAEDPLETLRRITRNAKARAAGIGEQDEEEPVIADTRRPQEPSGSAPEIERPAMDLPEVKVDRPRAALPTPGNGRNGLPSASETARAGARNGAGAGNNGAGAARARGEGDAGGDGAGARGTPVANAAPAEESEVAAERERFERLYNEGRTIGSSLEPGQLERGDLVFTGAHHSVVVRRGISTRAYWLKGELRLDQSGIEHAERNKYLVVGNVQ